MDQCKTKYTTLLDLSRQSKIITGDTACFDGKIQTGIPFSGYPTGVDLSTVVETGIIDSQTAVFSGNNVTTVFDVANPLSPNYSTIFSGDTYSADTWSNPIFSTDTSYLTLPITTLSADSQTTPTTWTLTQTGMTGDYIIGTQYTGYSITYSFFDVEENGEYSGTTIGYTGTTQASQISYSAQSLDYRGPLDYISSKENISVEGKLITNKLQVKHGADSSTIGYVLKQSDSEGNIEWGPDTSGSTTSITNYSYDTTNNSLTITLSDGTTKTATINEMTGLTINNDLIVNNDVGVGTDKPLSKLHVDGNILVANSGGSGVITLSGSGVSDAAINFDNTGSATPFSQIIGQTFGAGSSGNIEFNTNPGSGLTKRMTISTAGRVGIGNINNNDIEEELHVYDGDFLIERSGGRFSSVLNNSSGPLVRLSADTSDTLLSINVSTPNRGGLSMGARGLTDVGFPGYGKVGDGYIYSSNDQNGINIISSAGAGLEDYIRMYAGQDAVGTPDLYIQGTGTTRGFVGIHTDTPTTELDVNGDVNISGTLTVGSQVIGSTTTVSTNTNPNVNANTIFYNAPAIGGTITLNSQLNVIGNRVELIRVSGNGNPILSATGTSPNIINNATTMTLPTIPFSRTTCIYNGTQWFCTNQTP
tara:strand:- start:314 stop:2251 length:1938 start_codon:yes stop_codon:yes gene_type:complete